MCADSFSADVDAEVDVFLIVVLRIIVSLDFCVVLCAGGCVSKQVYSLLTNY